MKRTSLAAALLAPTLALAACGGDGAEGADAGPASAAPQGRQTLEADTTGAFTDADVDFVRMMLPHHEQALEMSRIVLSKPGLPPRVVELAQRIQDERGPEITRMTALLEAWGEPPVPPAPAGAAAGDDVADAPGDDAPAAPADDATATESPSAPTADPSSAPPADPSVHGEEAAPAAPAPAVEHVMPGMLTPEEMAAIEAADAPEAARLYLEGMIAHQRGAIDMARAELDGGASGEARKLAQEIVDEQESGIAIIRGILDAL